MSRNNEFKAGSNPKAQLTSLISNISVAKGLLATLSLEPRCLWINKYRTTPPEHLRILLLEVMEEICTAEKTLTQLRS